MKQIISLALIGIGAMAIGSESLGADMMKAALAGLVFSGICYAVTVWLRVKVCVPAPAETLNTPTIINVKRQF